MLGQEGYVEIQVMYRQGKSIKAIGRELVSCIKLTVDMRAFDAHAPLLSKSPQHFLSIRTVFYLRYVFR